MKIPLTTPLRLLGREISSLDLRDDVTAGDIWDLTPPVGVSGEFKAPSFGTVLAVAARLTRDPQLPEDAIRGLSAEDARGVYAAVLPLLFAGRPDGNGQFANSSSTAA